MNDTDFKSIPELFFSRAVRYGKSVILKCRINGAWQDISWEKLCTEVRALSVYLIQSGIKKGDRGIIYASNRYEWWLCDLALMSAGAVSVPFYPSLSAEEAARLAAHCGATVCFSGGASQARVVAEINSNSAKKIIHISMDRLSAESQGITSLYELPGFSGGALSPFLELPPLASNDPATIIYNESGSHEMKGVVLTHGNLLANVKQSYSVFNYVDESDVFLSILPLSHAFERTTGYLFPIYTGSMVVVSDGFRNFFVNMKKFRPSILICVPGLLEKIYERLRIAVSKKNFVMKWIFSFFSRVAVENSSFAAVKNSPVGPLKILVLLGNLLLYRRLKKQTGFDRLKVSISGGAALKEKEARFFIGIGLNIFEGYGLTEAGPVISVNRPGRIKFGSVGPPLNNTEVKISDENEILIKGPQVMRGYYNDLTSSAEAFTAEGYLKTGDTGYIDSESYIYITGRLKDIIITSGGKNISPVKIEKKLMDSDLIQRAVVLGEGKRNLSAALLPDIDNIRVYEPSASDIFNSALGELFLNDERINFLFSETITSILSGFSSYEQIKKFVLLNPSGMLGLNLKDFEHWKKEVKNNREIIEYLYPE